MSRRARAAAVAVAAASAVAAAAALAPAAPAAASPVPTAPAAASPAGRAAAAPPPAAAPSRFEPLGTFAGDDDHSGLVADGRYAAFKLPGRRIRIFDDRAGRHFDTRVPASCRHVFLTPIPTAIGGGQLLTTCRDRSLRFDLASRRWHRLPAAAGRPAAIGAHWVQLGDASNVFGGWYDWRRRVLRRDGPTPRRAVDLDLAGLTRPLCAPLGAPNDGDRFIPFGYEPPYGLPRPWSPGQWIPQALTIERCGSPRTVVLDRGYDDEGEVRRLLAGGWVAWGGVVTYSRRMHAYLPACGTRLTWGAARQVAHTARALYAVVDVPAGIWREAHAEVWRLPIPAGCGGLVRRLGAAAGGRATDVQAHAGDWRLPALANAEATALPIEQLPTARLRLADGAALELRTDVPARAVRWRLGDGPWRTATARAVATRRATATPRADAAAAPRTRWAVRGLWSPVAEPLRVVVRDRGGETRYRLRVSLRTARG